MEEKTRSDKQDGRIPPQDIGAEKSLLGALMLSDAAMPDILTIIKATDLYDPAHQTIFTAMTELYDTHRPVDLVTLTSELRKQKKLKEIGGVSYLTELSNFVAAASHAKAYAEIIEKASVRRRLIKAGSDIAEKAYADDADVSTLVGEAEQRLFEVSNKIVKSDYESLEDLMPGALERIVELKKNKGTLRGLKTGFPDVDKKIAGFQKGDLVIVGARPGMGKTTLAQNFAYNMANINKRGVLFFSMEMAKSEIIDRIISDVGSVDNWHIRTGNISDEEFARIDDAINEMDETPIYIDDTSSMTVFDIRNKARRAVHDHDIGAIIIDYLQLIQGSDRYKGNRVQEVTEISRALKILARELEVPVIALAQLSRNVAGRDDNRPMLSDLRESGSIEQDADLVMFVHRPGYYKKNEDADENITELIISKHRHGSVGTIDLYMEGKYCRFMSLDKTHD
ncbi:replicative DNA helicase [Candidatus Saccharibacteria bacterium]|nr:replicative DNA helicase [Candidatus Saccharibacteria bacterium]